MNGLENWHIITLREAIKTKDWFILFIYTIFYIAIGGLLGMLIWLVTKV